MRKTLFVLLGFALIVSTAKGVSASTDCQRWLAEYKTALAQKTATQHLLAAGDRARAAARRRLARLTRPAGTPHPTRISSMRPHLSPAQMLKRFDLACGDLPVEDRVLDERLAPEDFISEVAMGGPVEPVSVPADETMIAENTPPMLTTTGVTTDAPQGISPFVPVYGPVFGGGAFPLTPGSPTAGSPGHGGSPGGPGLPGGPGSIGVIPPAPPVAAVPEPGSIFLVLTGVLGGAALLTRRALA